MSIDTFMFIVNRIFAGLKTRVASMGVDVDVVD